MSDLEIRVRDIDRMTEAEDKLRLVIQDLQEDGYNYLEVLGLLTVIQQDIMESFNGSESGEFSEQDDD